MISSKPTIAKIWHCGLCHKKSELVKSHILPNAIFRRIKQKNGTGQLVHFDDYSDTHVVRSQDSWWEYLLCTKCEQIISAYEDYGLNLLRKCHAAFSRDSSTEGTSVKQDYTKLKLFLTSILWRSAIAKKDEFAKVILPEKYAESARQSLLSCQPLPPLQLGCKIAVLYDPTHVSQGGFSQNESSQILISPQPRLNEGESFLSFIYVIEGFLLEFFAPSIPSRMRNQLGVHKQTQSLFVPRISLFAIPELTKLLVSALEKHRNGQVKL